MSVAASNLERLKRHATFWVPAMFSLSLSFATVGTHVFWQDSGFYLTAVKTMSVLYPHGFVLYEVLCRVWTQILFFADFTLAVHLFSSFCAAGAAGVLALASRDFLASRSSSVSADPSSGPGWSGMLAGCITASGFTFWFSGLYAKTYALLFLMLSLLLWSIVRAERIRTPRSLTPVVVFAGLAWASHPSTALGLPALALFYLSHRRILGWRGLAWRVALGAAVAVAPLVLLPVLAQRDVEYSFGAPKTLSEIVHYGLGARFTAASGMFGVDPRRVAHLGRFFWEEYLGIAGLLVLSGLYRLARADRALLAGGALWLLPYMTVAVLFKMEGQSDYWFLAACLPLVPALALGLDHLGRRAPRHADLVRATVAAAAICWAVGANARDITQRGFELPELFGRLHFRNLAPDAILVSQSDHVLSIGSYLQSVKGERKDVVLVDGSRLASVDAGPPMWYEEALARQHSKLQLPDYRAAIRRYPAGTKTVFIAAFLDANRSGGRPLYTTVPLPVEQLPRGWVLTPQGLVWKLVPASEDRLEAEHWAFPIEPPELRKQFRRARGMTLVETSEGFEAHPEPYENRLLQAILQARTQQADWLLRNGRPDRAVGMYEALIGWDPEIGRNERLVQSMGLCYLAIGKVEPAERTLRLAVEIAKSPWVKAGSLLGLGDIYLRQGRADQAREAYLEASRVQGLNAEQRRAVDERLTPR